MKLLCYQDEYPCVRAEKDEAAGTVTAYGESGAVIFRATKVTDFSAYVLEGGEWSTPEPSGLEDRVTNLETAIADGLNLYKGDLGNG